MRRVQRRLLARLDRADEVGGRFLAHALELGELLDREPVEIGDVAHHAALDQLRDQLLAQPVDVERVLRGEVANDLAALAPGTACRCSDTPRRPPRG